MAVASCKHCGKEFHDTHAYRRVYCGRECVASAYSTRLTGVSNPNFRNAGTKICLHCGNDYRSYSKDRKFCSRLCATAHNYDAIVARGLRACRVPRKPRVKKTYGPCPVCGSERLTDGKTCSMACGNKLKTSTWAAHPKSEPPAPNRTCIQCHKEFFAYESSPRKFCSQSCSLANGTSFRAGMAALVARVKYGVKKDANHHLICDVLKAHGIPVYDLSSMGCGVPDCIVWVKDSWQFVEIKNPNTGYGRRGLNKIQRKWADQWRGGPVYIVRTIEQAEKFAKGDWAEIETVATGGAKWPSSRQQNRL